MQIFPDKWTFGHIVGILAFILVSAALIIFEANDRVFHGLDAFAMVATVVGLLLVADQLVKTRRISDAAREAAVGAKDSLTFFLRASEVSRVVKLIDEVKQCNRDKKKDVAIIRLQDIRNDLIFLQNNNAMKEKINQDQFDTFVLDLGVMINGIDKDIQRGTSAVNNVDANRRLDNIATALVKLDSLLKQ